MERLSTYDIQSKVFTICFRGYDVVEVNEFMDLVIKHRYSQAYLRLGLFVSIFAQVE